MFNSSNDGNDLLSYTDHNTVPSGPLFSELYSPIFKLEDPSYFFNLPSPFCPNQEDIDSYFLQNYDLWHYQQPLATEHAAGSVENTTLVCMEEYSCREDINGEKNNKDLTKKEGNPPMGTKRVIRKKSSSSDRHSKIYTAQGPRDRRMRMSLEVARKFFALQDMLGFDKASKTVEWLLTQAGDEIKKLSRSFSTLNQSCSAKVVTAGNQEKEETDNKEEKTTLRCLSKVKKKKAKQRRKASFQPLGKEIREKARARARERTEEKMRSRRLNELKICDEVMTNHEMNKIVSRNIPSQAAVDNSGFKAAAEVEETRCHRQDCLEMTTEKRIEDNMELMQEWSPSSVIDYLQRSGTSREHQVAADVHFSGKPWDVYNNLSIR